MTISPISPSSPPSPSSTTPPLHLIFRPSTSSLMDLSLTIPSPTTTSVLSLLPLLRARLPPALRASTIRLIYSGRLLPLHSSLATALPFHAFTPPTAPAPDTKGESKGQVKGKTPLRPLPPVYIHASLSSDPGLTAIELAKEADDARALDARLASGGGASTSNTQDASTSASASASATIGPSVNARPLGFDRLLSAGFTAAEISTLRAQFTRVHAHAHTPDSMPSAAALVRLEERWLDENHSAGGGGGGGGGAEGGGWGGSGGDEEAASALDDMLWGNVMGFFWPLACVVWLLREEGVWSARRRIAVGTGVLVNFVFGVLRWGVG